MWTRHAIDQERQDFFDTSVTGRAEIWQTLHTVLEILWEADLVDATAVTGASSSTTAAFRTPIGVADAAVGVATHSPAEGSADHDASEARATAQSILDAADITLPTGDMAQGAYDAFGNFYALPAWIVSDPTNLDDDPEHELDEAKGALYDDDYEDDEEDGDAADEADDHGEAAEAGPTGATVESAAEAGGAGERSAREKQDSPQTPTSATATTVTNTTSRRRREEKGKGIVVAANQIVVRARLSSASTRDVVIHLGREETVRSLVHRISEGAKVCFLFRSLFSAALTSCSFRTARVYALHTSAKYSRTARRLQHRAGRRATLLMPWFLKTPHSGTTEPENTRGRRSGARPLFTLANHNFLASTILHNLFFFPPAHEWPLHCLSFILLLSQYPICFLFIALARVLFWAAFLLSMILRFAAERL